MNSFIKINQMEAGKEYSTCLLIKNIEEKVTSTGKPYCIIHLCDGKDEIKAKLWNSEKKNLMADISDVILCQIKVSTYNNAKDYTLGSYRKTITSDGVDMGDFIPKAPLDSEFMYKKIMEKISHIKDENLKKLSENIYSDNKEKLLKWSAAKAVHHNYYGGLLYHTYRMLESAEALLGVYSGLSYDALISGVALHDIGKLLELDTNSLGESVYTIQGQLEGHIVLGVKMIMNYVHKLGLEDSPAVEHLNHIILSHHGELEWGSPVKPHTMEAITIHMLDNMDTKYFQYEKYQGEPGTMSAERIFGLGINVFTPCSE